MCLPVSRDLVGIDLVEPMHGQVIGLVMTDRDPLPPMANALIAATGGADLEDGLAAATRGKVDQAFLSIVQKLSLDKDRV